MMKTTLHKMKLQPKPFEAIDNETKTVEMRLYDEKRQKIEISDEIEFTNIETQKTLKVVVTDLILFRNFEELYKNFNKTELGYSPDEEASFKDMEQYYPKEEQAKYGVIAIKFQVI